MNDTPETEPTELEDCAEALKLYGYEGYNAVIKRFEARCGAKNVKLSKQKGWHFLTCAGVTARSRTPGMDLLTNWGQAARRELQQAA